MKNLQKGFVVPLLIAIIAVLVIGGGVYIYNNKKVEAPVVVDTGTQSVNQNQQQTNTQTPQANNSEPCTNNGSMGTRKCNPPQTNTLNWKTYTNTKYGFEIKYPADWYVTDLSSLNHYLLALNPQTRQIPSDTLINRDGDYKGYIEITISPNPAKLSLQSFYDGTKRENLYSKDIATNGVEKIITMNKVEGVLFKGVIGLGIYNIASFGLDNNVVEVQDNSQKPYDSNSIFARIISTFKFNKTPTVATQPIKVISPNGGETWALSDFTKMIKWNYPSELNRFSSTETINLATPDRSKTWKVFEGNLGVVTTIPNQGEVPWSSLSSNLGVPSGQYVININIIDGLTHKTYTGTSGIFKVVTTEKASGIIKSVYSKSGKNYIDIDYIEWNPNWAPGGGNGSAYQNNNPQIRTFEITSNAKFFSAGDVPITFLDFQKYFTTTGSDGLGYYQMGNPWDIVVTDGLVTQITEHFLP